LKRRDLIKKLIAHGCFMHRRGAKHDIYMNRNNGGKAPVPRHNEIKNTLCVLIEKQLGLDD
jgi:mRNA interferase HicA